MSHFPSTSSVVEVAENRSATLVCNADRSLIQNGSYVLLWEKEGTGPLLNVFGRTRQKPHVAAGYEDRLAVGPEDSLIIKKVREIDGGIYRCVLQLTSKRHGHPKANITLVIQTIPLIIDAPPTHVYRSPGQSLSLDCSAKGEPTPTIQWIKDNVVIGEGSREKIFDGRLELDAIDTTMGPTVNYTCVAMNKLGTDKRTTTLWFARSAWIEEPPRNKSVLEGSTVVWPCRAKGHPNELNYDWLYNQRKIRLAEGLGLRAKIEGGALTISPVKRNDSGWYTCSVTNGFGEPANAAAYLDIRYLPEVTKQSESKIQYAPLGLSAHIRCEIDSNPPAYYVKWAKGAEKWRVFNYDSDKKFSIEENGLALRIRNVERTDAGVYTCKPANDVGEGQAFEIHVIVAEPPFYTEEPEQEIRTKPGGNVTTHCAGGGIPAPKIFWRKKNGNPVSQSENGRATLNFDHVTAKNHGVYECVVENKVTTLVKETYVIVLETAPQAPEKVSILTEAFDATVNWKPGFDGGYEQKFSLLYGAAENEDSISGRWDTKDVDKATNIKILKLHPDTTYTFKVIPRNKFGTGFSSQPVVARTKGSGSIGSVLPTDTSGVTYFPEIQRPIGPSPNPPRHFRVISVNHEVEFNWDPPVDKPTVRIYHYSLEFKHSRSKNNAANAQESFETLKREIKDTRLRVIPGAANSDEKVLIPGKTYDFRVKAHSIASYSLPSNSVSYMIPGVSPQLAIIASILGGMLFLLLFLILGCILVRRAKRSKGKDRYEKQYEHTNGSTLQSNGGVHQTMMESVDSPFPGPKQHWGIGSIDVRSKGVPSVANRIVNLFSSNNTHILPLGQSTPKLERMKDISDGFSSRLTDTTLLTTVGNQSSLTRAVAKHESNFSDFLRQTQGTPKMRRNDPDASVDSIGGLLKNFQTNSWNRSQNRQSEPVGQVEFRPIGESGYVFKTNQSASYDRDRLLGTISKLRQTGPPIQRTPPIDYEQHSFKTTPLPKIPSRAVGVTRPRPRTGSNSSNSSNNSNPMILAPNRILLSTVMENGPLSSSSSGFSSQEDRSELFPSTVTDMLREKYIYTNDRPQNTSHVRQDSMEPMSLDEERFLKLKKEFHRNQNLLKTSPLSRTVIESDVL